MGPFQTKQNISCGGRVDMGGRCDELHHLELLKSEDSIFS